MELLQNRFPKVNVDAYFKVAEACVKGTLRWDKTYRLDIAKTKPLEALIRLSIDKVASAYVLISGVTDQQRINELLKDYLLILESYLEKTGYLS